VGAQARKAYEPYFYLLVKEKYYAELEGYLRRKYTHFISSVSAVNKEDLDLVRRRDRIVPTR
jgi:hypothetical protein